ncbi:glycosyltransferase family 2 protein [Methylophilus sp. 'Pure River']|uniref:glycosyltransferase family 2 protein n=1 Tax=Methylophilus sp. 'Pure River' TaxID=3377117 RepID=UPI00398EBD49
MIYDALIALFYLVLLLLAIPVLTFAFQILIAILPGYRKSVIVPSQERIAILIPAHNESAGIEHTLQSVKQQATTNTRIVVVADNCSDNTAEVARQAGVEAVERFDQEKRGKGYALDFGLQFLKQSPPEIVMVFDADCQIDTGTIDALANAVVTRQRAIQALYLIQSKASGDIKSKIAEFAYVVKSWTRPLGFHRLGLPMQLMGSGMAFPWQQIENANLVHGSIVEDMKLGIDLTIAYRAPGFCPEAYVTSLFPEHDAGTESQRKRWEHGHISMIVKEGIPLLVKGIKSFNFSIVAMALDLIVPPLALLFLLSALFAFVSAAAWILTGDAQPWSLGVGVFAILTGFVLIAWFKHGRNILPIMSLFAYAPVYALSKIKLYLNFFKNRQVEWVKSRKD